MAKKVYSTYEVRARLGEMLDRVSQGDVVTITRRGKAVAEIRPIEETPQADEETSADSAMAKRIEELRQRGIISGGGTRGSFKPLAHRPGGLKRFLDDR